MAINPLNNKPKKTLSELTWPQVGPAKVPQTDLKPLHPDQIQGKIRPGAIDLEKKGLPIQSANKNNDPKEIKKAAQMMEGFFIQMLLKEMDKTVNRSGFLDGGFAEEIFRGMLQEKMGDEMAKAGGLGLGQMIEKQMLPRTGKIPVSYGFTKALSKPAEKELNAPEKP